MSERLRFLIEEFLETVAQAVALMEQSGIERPPTRIEWALRGIPYKGVLQGGYTYKKHGYGCFVRLETAEIDFDFGERGEINGFDAWRLRCFAQDRLARFRYQSEAEIEEDFLRAAASGEILDSGSGLYYLAPRNG